jgi:hypothetical protein
MMLGWTFSARTVDEVARLIRALGKHRYVREVDHRLHWTVDAALADQPEFAPHAARFAERRRRERELEIASRDPTLWRPATADEVILALSAFWTPGDVAARSAERLVAALAETGLPPAEHAPFTLSPDELPHPELILLDWVLLPVDELDTERHAGALACMEDAGEEVNASVPLYQEGPVLAAPELCRGAPNGVLADDFLIWSDEPYSYSDYVLRGASRAAKLVDPPVGYHDIE